MKIQGVGETISYSNVKKEPIDSEHEFSIDYTGKTGKKNVLTCIHVSTGETIRFSTSDDFSPNNPRMVARIISETGEESEEIIDASKVNPNNASFVEMLALSSTLKETDKISGVPGIFISEVYESSGLSKRQGINQRCDFTFYMNQEMNNLLRYGYLDVYAKHRKEYDLILDRIR